MQLQFLLHPKMNDKAFLNRITLMTYKTLSGTIIFRPYFLPLSISNLRKASNTLKSRLPYTIITSPIQPFSKNLGSIQFETEVTYVTYLRILLNRPRSIKYTEETKTKRCAFSDQHLHQNTELVNARLWRGSNVEQGSSGANGGDETRPRIEISHKNVIQIVTTEEKTFLDEFHHFL